MVLNAWICHFVCFGNNKENKTFSFKSTFGVITDNKLNFKSHISSRENKEALSSFYHKIFLIVNECNALKVFLLSCHYLNYVKKLLKKLGSFT